ASKRNLHTVTIAGGEPTLHPDIHDVIKFLNAEGMRTVLLTNGNKVTREYASELKKTGIDLVLFHIDWGQSRAEYSGDISREKLKSLRQEKIQILGKAGIDTGIVATIYDEQFGDLDDLINLISTSNYAHFLLATLDWAPSGFEAIQGNIDNGLFKVDQGEIEKGEVLKHDMLLKSRQLLKAKGMAPFGYIGSSADKDDHRWLCFSSATAVNSTGETFTASMTSSLSERVLIKLVRFITGKYMYYVPRNAIRFAIQLMLNSLTGGRFLSNWRILFKAMSPGTSLHEKRFVIQKGPNMDKDGQIVHCDHCPDATVVNNSLIPICLSDCVEQVKA
ncbi:MAG: radical SAM protein, partial [Planctomycetes bacterium]|nr:radical SAM protein [Planctomycetota bacterium]